MCHAVFMFIRSYCRQHPGTRTPSLLRSRVLGRLELYRQRRPLGRTSHGSHVDIWCRMMWVNRIAQDGESFSLSGHKFVGSIPHFQSQWVISSLWFRPLCSHHDICVMIFHYDGWIPTCPWMRTNKLLDFPWRLASAFADLPEDCKAWRFPVHKSVERAIW